MSRIDRVGASAALLSYFFWGFFPIYWKYLGHLEAIEVLLHRVIWSFVFYAVLLKATSGLNLSLVFKQSQKDWGLSFLAAILLSLNWGLYIYAVNTGHILEGSLAYFINPMLNVFVGVLLFKEVLPTALKISISIAAAGVAWRIWAVDGVPWISLVLAFTFCGYGILKKMLKIQPRLSSVMESLSILLPALALAYLFRMRSPVEELSTSDWALLICSGAVTGIPLYLFSVAAQRVPYSFLGMNQFIAPSLQFLVGYYMYQEQVSFASWISFFLIWVGAGIYLVYQFQQMFQKR